PYTTLFRSRTAGGNRGSSGRSRRITRRVCREGVVVIKFRIGQENEQGYCKVFYPRRGQIGWIHHRTKFLELATSTYTRRSTGFANREESLKWLLKQTTVTPSDLASQGLKPNFWDQ